MPAEDENRPIGVISEARTTTIASGNRAAGDLTNSTRLPSPIGVKDVSSVDVIVPCYGYGHFLTECVESVLGQEGVSARVLIIDDASPDHTDVVGRALAGRDSRVTFRRHATNKGHIATYNEGIEWASAEHVLLLSADDYLLPGALGRACRLLEKRPSLGFVFGEAVILHPDGSTEAVHPPVHGDGRETSVMTGAEFISASGAANIVPTPTAVVRTELQKRTGGYRPELPHSGDMEMWFRLAALAEVGFIASPLGVYRRHEANMSLAYLGDHLLTDLRERLEALSVFFATGAAPLASDPAVRQTLLRSLALQAVGRASMALNEGDPEGSKALRAFAVEVWPTVRTSPAWIRLAAKRLVGAERWRSMRSAKAMLSGRG